MKIHVRFRAAEHHKSLDAEITSLVAQGDVVVVYCKGNARLVSYTSVYANRQTLCEIRYKLGWSWVDNNRVFGPVHLNTEYGEGPSRVQDVFPDAVVASPQWQEDSLELERDMEYFVEPPEESDDIEESMEPFIEPQDRQHGDIIALDEFSKFFEK